MAKWQQQHHDQCMWLTAGLSAMLLQHLSKEQWNIVNQLWSKEGGRNPLFSWQWRSQRTSLERCSPHSYLSSSMALLWSSKTKRFVCCADSALLTHFKTLASAGHQQHTSFCLFSRSLKPKVVSQTWAWVPSSVQGSQAIKKAALVLLMSDCSMTNNIMQGDNNLRLQYLVQF